MFANARKNRLIVRNLPFKIEEDGLKKAFGAFGSVQEVSIPRRKDDPKKMLGFGFVQFGSGDHAAAALKVSLGVGGISMYRGSAWVKKIHLNHSHA